MTRQQIQDAMKEEMRRQGLTITGLSRKSGIARQTIVDWFDSRRIRGAQFDTVIQMAQALGMEIVVTGEPPY